MAWYLVKFRDSLPLLNKIIIFIGAATLVLLDQMTSPATRKWKWKRRESKTEQRDW